MNKVFIGGSRRISRLNLEVRKRIDRIIEKHLSVVIGDANGADKAVQNYLKSRQYDQVEVFCVEGSCRNNAGNWPLRPIPALNARKDFTYYETKDKAMADEASLGFMIWDGKSIGTLMNVFRLLSQHKKVVVYAVPVKEFSNLRNEADWNRFLMRFGNDLRRRIERRADSGDREMSIANQASLFSNNKFS
jgi:hypothetical protein